VTVISLKHPIGLVRGFRGMLRELQVRSYLAICVMTQVDFMSAEIQRNVALFGFLVPRASLSSMMRVVVGVKSGFAAVLPVSHVQMGLPA